MLHVKNKYHMRKAGRKKEKKTNQGYGKQCVAINFDELKVPGTETSTNSVAGCTSSICMLIHVLIDLQQSFARYLFCKTDLIILVLAVEDPYTKASSARYLFFYQLFDSRRCIHQSIFKLQHYAVTTLHLHISSITIDKGFDSFK